VQFLGYSIHAPLLLVGRFKLVTGLTKYLEVSVVAEPMQYVEVPATVSSRWPGRLFANGLDMVYLDLSTGEEILALRAGILHTRADSLRAVLLISLELLPRSVEHRLPGRVVNRPDPVDGRDYKASQPICR
jgi:hypothetical protein